MNKAAILYEEFGKALQTPGPIQLTPISELQKKCVEVFIKEMEKLITEFDIHSIEWWSYRCQEIREDLEEI